MFIRKRTGHLGMTEEQRLARRTSIGGSDAKIIMSGDQQAIERLWMEKRGEVDSVDMSEILLVQMGNVIEPLNQDWFELQTGMIVTNEQDKVFHPAWDGAHATLDGLIRRTPEAEPHAMLECKFMFPFGFEKQAAMEKYFPQCQHNMACTGMPTSHLSIITGAAQWIDIEIEADLFYQIALLEAEKDFMDCVKTGRRPGAPVIEVPLAERIRIVDMSKNNEWAAFAASMVETKTYVEKHEKAKKGIKKLMPADAMIAEGHGIKISLSKDGKQLIKIDDAAVKEADARNGLVAANDDEPAKPKTTRKKKAPAAEPAAEAA